MTTPEIFPCPNYQQETEQSLTNQRELPGECYLCFEEFGPSDQAARPLECWHFICPKHIEPQWKTNQPYRRKCGMCRSDAESFKVYSVNNEKRLNYSHVRFVHSTTEQKENTNGHTYVQIPYMESDASEEENFLHIDESPQSPPPLGNQNYEAEREEFLRGVVSIVCTQCGRMEPILFNSLEFEQFERTRRYCCSVCKFSNIKDISWAIGQLNRAEGQEVSEIDEPQNSQEVYAHMKETIIKVASNMINTKENLLKLQLENAALKKEKKKLINGKEQITKKYEKQRIDSTTKIRLLQVQVEQQKKKIQELEQKKQSSKIKIKVLKKTEEQKSQTISNLQQKQAQLKTNEQKLKIKVEKLTTGREKRAKQNADIRRNQEKQQELAERRLKNQILTNNSNSNKKRKIF